jgi:SAM-dependent methyltransferase
VAENAPLPLGAETFDLVINRHESFDVAEICRILQSPGTFLTQQVGPRNCIQLNQYLEAPWEPEINYWSLDLEKSAVEAAGLQLLRAEEQLLDSIFFDIGAVVYYLKVIEWQIPDFAMDTYYDRLYALHQLIERQGAFFATAHRYLIEAQKP